MVHLATVLKTNEMTFLASRETLDMLVTVTRTTIASKDRLPSSLAILTKDKMREKQPSSIIAVNSRIMDNQRQDMHL
jgi:hypothetical protein